jgi:hypothetical protein
MRVRHGLRHLEEDRQVAGLLVGRVGPVCQQGGQGVALDSFMAK